MRVRIRGSALAMFAAASLAASTAGQARAEFMFLSQSAVYDPGTGYVRFTIEFNQAPDFFTVDGFGRGANSFQFRIFGDRSQPYPQLYDSIIRGEEIRVTGSTLPIRNSAPPDPAPTSGGWGPIRGSVPFHLDGNVLTFSTPLSLISDHSTDGRFTYDFITTEYGGTTRSVTAESTVTAVPEPSTAVLLSLACATLGSRFAGASVLSSLRRRGVSP